MKVSLPQRKFFVWLLLPMACFWIADQWSKYIIRSNTSMQNLSIIDQWLEFYYVQNMGMALGIKLLPPMITTFISIMVVIGLSIYVYKIYKKTKPGILFCTSMILGGAMGNITDRVFLGVIQQQGRLFEGAVVDFIFFSRKIYGEYIFPYIFNIADASITTAFFILIIFYSKDIVGIKRKANDETPILDNHNETSQFSEKNI